MACCTYPVRKRRTSEIHALARVDLRLLIERKVIGILCYQYMREQFSSCTSGIVGESTAATHPRIALDSESEFLPHVFRRRYQIRTCEAEAVQEIERGSGSLRPPGVR
jgi:hypothetical protein